MKKLLLGLLVAGASGPAMAAAGGLVSLGLKGGATLSTATATAGGVSVTGYGYGQGYLAGLGLDIGVGVAGVEVDALYAIRKAKIPGDQTSTLTSVVVPAVLKFGMGPLFLAVGGYYSQGLGKVDTDGSKASYAANNLKTSDYGLTAGVGVKLVKFGIEGRYNMGMVNVSTANSYDVKNKSIDVLASFWF